MHHHKFFKWFLVVYALFLIYNAIELQFFNPLVIIGLIAGLTLALISHSYHGKIALFLLVIHMGVDSINHALYFQSYGIKEYVFGLLHLGMDLTFLYEESFSHTKNPKKILALILAGLVILFIVSRMAGLQISDTTHEPIEAVVMSGIFGCILFHFWRKKQHVH